MTVESSSRTKRRTPSDRSGVFLTGATGFLGRRLLADLLRGGEAVTALVRAADESAARQRIAGALASTGASLPPDPSQLTVCTGSLDRPGMGLSSEHRERILETCGSFLHCAASVRFDLSLEDARAVNVEGARGVLDLARARAGRGKLLRCDFISTAYVAGDRTDVVMEGELDPSVHHRNTYERSKFEAELLLRDAAGDLPVTVYRPSIVTPMIEGDARSPIDWPLRVYANGWWRTCPGRPETPLDLVTTRFVCQAIHAVRKTPESIGRTVHLTSGAQGAVTLGEAATAVHDRFPKRKPVRFVDPEKWARYVHPLLRWFPGRTGEIVSKAQYYLPYFTGNPRFDNSTLRSLVESSGVEIPTSRNVLETLLADTMRPRFETEHA